MDYQSSKTLRVLEDFFGSIGLPTELALPIGLLEVIGGIFLLVRVVTRITAALFIIDMIGATLLVKISKGFVGGYELDLLLMAVCISLLLMGPGRISIEWDVLKGKYYQEERLLFRAKGGSKNNVILYLIIKPKQFGCLLDPLLLTCLLRLDLHHYKCR